MRLTNRLQLWKIDASGEERKVTYLATLQKHTQAVNVVRWCPRGMLKPGVFLNSYADPQQVKCSRPPETTATSFFGYPPKTRHTTRLLEKMPRTTWKRGGSKQCAGRVAARKYMTWHGRPMECSSSLEAWTTLRGYTALQMVRASSERLGQLDS